MHLEAARKLPFPAQYLFYNYSDNDSNYAVAENTNDYLTVTRSTILDAKSAMDLILAQPSLMLNGELLSDESKITLANAIQLGLQYAEQMQKKEKDDK